MLCADDKLRIFEELKKSSTGQSIMCGDSLSDLGALLAADYGLVIGNSSSLRNVMSAVGIELRSIKEGIDSGSKWRTGHERPSKMC